MRLLYILKYFQPKCPLSLATVETAALLAEVSHLVPAVPSDVICLDSSGEEEEKEESNLPVLAIRNGKGDDSSVKIYYSFFQLILSNTRFD